MSETASLGRRVLVALAGAVAIAVMAGGAWHGYRTVVSQPVKRVIFAGELDRLRHADLDALSQAIQAAPPASVTLASVREAAKRVPWVREATVRRRFPDTVEITFEAHEAVARWNDHQLLNRHGEVFTAADASDLPRLRGPDGSGADDACRATRRSRGSARPARLRCGSCAFPRAAPGRCCSTSGMVLELGRDRHRTRALGRFVGRLAPGEQRSVRASASLRRPALSQRIRGADARRAHVEPSRFNDRTKK